MAETLTLNTDPDSATNAENLTPEEQDSLAIGEKMVAERGDFWPRQFSNPLNPGAHETNTRFLKNFWTFSSVFWLKIGL